MRRPLLAWLAMLLGLAFPAEAHEVNLVTARVALSPNRTVSVDFGLKGSDVDRLIGTKIYDARRDAVDPTAVEAAKPAILAYMVTHLAVTGGARGCSAGNAAILADGDGIIYRNNFVCADTAGDIIYRSTVLLIAHGRSETQALLDADNTRVTLSTAQPSLFSPMRRYLVTGMEHIFLGYDHVAFLVAIVLWARKLVPVIKIVTAFTIAHSLTLSLAALNILVIPSDIVEPAIAASIVFVAVENFFSRDVDRRWRVAFLFGLIHGFGFAGVLREIGLPPDAIVPALAAFNIGVEIGQVAIVAVALPILRVADRWSGGDGSAPVRAAGLVYTFSAVIGLLGGYWLVARVFEA